MGTFLQRACNSADQLVPVMGASVNAINVKISIPWVGEDADWNTNIGSHVYMSTNTVNFRRLREYYDEHCQRC
jgi:hypothetical protein